MLRVKLLKYGWTIAWRSTVSKCKTRTCELTAYDLHHESDLDDEDDSENESYSGKKEHSDNKKTDANDLNSGNNLNDKD